MGLESTAYAPRNRNNNKNQSSFTVNLDPLLQGHLQGRRSLYSEDFLKNMGVEASAGVKTFADETRISAVCAEYVDSSFKA